MPIIKRATIPAALLLATVSMAACGALVVSTTVPTSSTATPASTTATATSTTPSPTPSLTPTGVPSGPQLDISQFGVEMTLTTGLGEVDYDILGAGATSHTDLKGNPYTELPSVALWTASLAADPACSAIEQDGLVTIWVFSTNPTTLSLANGPPGYKEVGQDWFGITPEKSPQCTDANPAEQPAVQALVQAFATIQAD